MNDARLSQACTLVEAYIERSMAPAPEGAAAYVAPDFKIALTGDRRFAAPADTAAFNAKHYHWVKTRLGQTHAALDRAGLAEAPL